MVTSAAKEVVEAPFLTRVANGDASAVKACIACYGGLVWSLARRFSAKAWRALSFAIATRSAFSPRCGNAIATLWRACSARNSAAVAANGAPVSTAAPRPRVRRPERQTRGALCLFQQCKFAQLDHGFAQ